MNRIVVIKKLEDLKEYCSEKVCMYGEKVNGVMMSKLYK